MEWTYSLYTGVIYGISIGLCVFVFIGVCGTFFSSKKGREFVIDRVIGVDPNKVEDEDDATDADKKNQKDTDNNNQKDVEKDNQKDGDKDTEKDAAENNVKEKLSKTDKKSVLVITTLFCFLAALTLSITAVLIFEGCFLASTRLLPNDNCPDYPMDCFVFPNATAHDPISDSATFHCDPSNTTQFPSNMSDATAWCFGWIIRLQTTKDILDQLGVCTGLIGLFTTLLAVVIYLGRSKKTLVLCSIFILCCIVAVILLVFYKWSFAPLTYAVLFLGMSLGSFGLLLFCIIPKHEKQKNSGQTSVDDTDKATVVSNPIASLSMSRPPTTKSPVRIKILRPSSKITPQ
jgi:hypothetical protein